VRGETPDVENLRGKRRDVLAILITSATLMGVIPGVYGALTDSRFSVETTEKPLKIAACPQHPAPLTWNDHAIDALFCHFTGGKTETISLLLGRI
jgi:hypothetical protein